MHYPTPLHMPGVTPTSQELVQSPIHLSKPASDAVLNKSVEEAQRICPAFNTFLPAPIAQLNNYSHRPRRTRTFEFKGSHSLRQRSGRRKIHRVVLRLSVTPYCSEAAPAVWQSIFGTAISSDKRPPIASHPSGRQSGSWPH
jgi:hypothetical protein